VCWLSVNKLRERFSNFIDAELRSLEILSPTEITLTMALQDKARDFDWIMLDMHFSGVSDARIVDNHKLSFIDMSNGASLLEEGTIIAFGTGECYNIEDCKNATLYIIAKNLKTDEGIFKG